MKAALCAGLLVAASGRDAPDGPEPREIVGRLCSPASPEQGGCNIIGSNCEGERVEFQAYNLTIDKWDNETKTYSTLGLIESHAKVGTKDDWEMYLHGPLIRPKGEIEEDANVPPFYVSATWTNMVYRFDHVKRGARGEPLMANQKIVANALAPSTAYPVEWENGTVRGLLVAEGQPLAWLNKNKTDVYYGGVDYITNDVGEECHQVFPNEADTESNMSRGEVVNTVSCQKDNRVCFFSVWAFYDDQDPFWNIAEENGFEDCLHYCVTEDVGDCKYGGVVLDEHGERICHEHGQGAVHGMTVAHLDKEDPTQFDIFLVFTGGSAFVGGESSMKKVRCQMTESGDLTVTKTAIFGRDLFEGSVGRNSTYGMAERDVGGDHAWPDASGKYLWVSTFRLTNPGVHMLDYETGELLLSIHGMDSLVPDNYAYSAGIHGVGSLGEAGSLIVVGTSACANVDKCAPIPYKPWIPERLKAKGIMYILDISEILNAEEAEEVAKPVVV